MILAFNFSECCGRSHRPNPKRTVQAPQTWGQYTCRSDIHLSIGRALMRVSSSARKTSSGTASPPDVRRWLGPAGALHLATGCAPGAGLALLCVRWTCLRISMQQNSEARAPTSASVSLKKITRLANRGSNPHQGHSPVTQPAKRREHSPPPHIRRRSRTQSGAFAFATSSILVCKLAGLEGGPRPRSYDENKNRPD